MLPGQTNQDKLPELIYAKDIQGKDGFYFTYTVPYTISQNANDYGRCLTLHNACELMSVSEWHNDVATDGGDVTLMIKKQVDTDAWNGGVNLLTTAFNLKSTAKTTVLKTSKDLTTTQAYRRFKAGDGIGMSITAANLNGFRHCQLTFYFKYLYNGDYRNA